jgi:hypothetical protein
MGHDASGFKRIPKSGDQELTLIMESEDSCTIQLPFEQ